MSQHDFEPDATKFTAAPEFTEADFSTPGHDTWTSTEHPGHADPHGPGAWGSPQEYGQPEDMNGQGVFVPAHDDPWGTEPDAADRNSPAQERMADTARAAPHDDTGPDQRLRRRRHRYPPCPRHPARASRQPRRDSQPARTQRPVRKLVTGRQAPAITRTGAERVLANYWRVNNAANQSRSSTLLATIEAGSSYAMDAGTYRMSRVTDPADSQYAPFTAENAIYYIPRQPAGVYPRWFAARVTYATLASPQHATGAGYMLFIQDAKDAAWKNILEPYLLTAARPAPFIQTDAQGYAIQAPLTSAARLAAAPAQIPHLTAESLDGATPAVTIRNPGNLADLRNQAYFQFRLPAGSADTDRHDTAGLVFALKTVGGGALVFYHLTARLSLAAPPGQTINLRVSGYYSPSQALTSAAVDYAEQFAVYLPAGSAAPAVIADASGITGRG